MIYKDIITELKNDPTIFSMVDNRIYSAVPVEAPKQAYITFSRQNRTIDMVRSSQMFRFMCYAPGIEERESLVQALIDFIQESNLLDSSIFFSMWHEYDGAIDTKLKTGHYAGYVLVGMRKVV